MPQIALIVRATAVIDAIDTEQVLRYIRLMFGISGEHLLIMGIVLLIFGPKRLPELGNTLGKAIKNFKDSISGVEEAKFRRIEPQQGSQPESHAAAPVSQEAPQKSV